jgi:hypothetical protein
LEIDPAGSRRVAFMTNNRQYWTVTGDGTISATGKSKGANEYFTVEVWWSFEQQADHGSGPATV